MLRLHLLALLALVASCAFGLASAQAWDDGDAQIAVRLSWAAYCPVTQVNAWTCYWCTHAGTPRLTVMGTTVDGPTNTMGYVGFYDRTIVVVYRGTTNFKNLLVDLDFGKSQPWGDQPGEVHSGFLKSHRNLWSGVLQNIIKAKSRCPKCNRVLFTGHSLGAAITTLASVELARNPIGLSIQALTLGSPRVGNQKFVDYASRMVPNAIRWVHTTDPVAHVPPRSVFKYAHRAREVWQSAASTYRLCSQTNGEDSSCSDSVPFYDLHDLDTHSVYGGVDLHSGGCATFAKRSETDALTLNKLIEMANTDSFQQATQD